MLIEIKVLNKQWSKFLKKMSVLTYIILFTLIGSIASLIGGIILLAREKFAVKISHFLSAFAAGALLSTAFLDLLPEAQEKTSEFNIFLFALLGFLFFFLLERFIHWSHHHQTEAMEITRKAPKSIITLINIGDAVHNFVDGVVIASTFLVSIPLGIITSFAVAAHEIPQEIGDFGIMLHQGVKRKKVLLFNVLSATTSMIGAILTYIYGDSVKQYLPVFLSIAAGFFIYIAASDLIPEIHNEEKRSIALTETLLLLLGVFVVWGAIQMLGELA